MPRFCYIKRIIWKAFLLIYVNINWSLQLNYAPNVEFEKIIETICICFQNHTNQVSQKNVLLGEVSPSSKGTLFLGHPVSEHQLRIVFIYLISQRKRRQYNFKSFVCNFNDNNHIILSLTLCMCKISMPISCMFVHFNIYVRSMKLLRSLITFVNFFYDVLTKVLFQRFCDQSKIFFDDQCSLHVPVWVRIIFSCSKTPFPSLIILLMENCDWSETFFYIGCS